MKQTMLHEEIRDAFSEIYNSFYLKHRIKDRKQMSEETWEKIMEDANVIRNKYNSQFVSDMIIALMNEFERECSLNEK